MTYLCPVVDTNRTGNIARPRVIAFATPHRLTVRVLTVRDKHNQTLASCALVRVQQIKGDFEAFLQLARAPGHQLRHLFFQVLAMRQSSLDNRLLLTAQHLRFEWLYFANLVPMTLARTNNIDIVVGGQCVNDSFSNRFGYLQLFTCKNWNVNNKLLHWVCLIYS